MHACACTCVTTTDNVKAKMVMRTYWYVVRLVLSGETRLRHTPLETHWSVCFWLLCDASRGTEMNIEFQSDGGGHVQKHKNNNTDDVASSCALSLLTKCREDWVPVNRKMHCLSPCLHYACPAAFRIAARGTCQNLSKLFFPPCLTQGRKNSLEIPTGLQI